MSVTSKLTFLSLLIACGMGASAAAQVIINPSTMKALPKTSPAIIAALKSSCTNVDLGISSVRIDKLEGGKFTATYEIQNFGRDAWQSSQGQAGSILTIASTSARNPSSSDTLLSLNAAPGAIVNSVTGPRYSVNYGLRGSRNQVKYTLDILINFDPDLRNDGNTCNDDGQAQNNSFYLGSKLDDFLYLSRDNSKTFTFADRQGPLPMEERTASR